MPNNSFEQINSCPNAASQLAEATPWFHSFSFLISSDIFNSCGTPSWNVPLNFIGTQQAKSGNGYAGIIVYDKNSALPYREFLEVRLIAPLVISKNYCIKYHISFADSSNYAIKNIGLKLSQDSLLIDYPNSLLLNYTPEITCTSGLHLNNDTSWTTIEGVFNSSGNERFITLGNFQNDINPDTLYEKKSLFSDFAYYYIDDVSVVEVSPASAGNDTTICTGDIATIGGIPTFEATYNWYALNGSSNISIDSANIAKPHVNPIVNTTYVMQKTQCSVTTYDTVLVNVNCVGINEYLNNKNKEAVYPNPNKGLMQANIRLNVGEKGEIVIYDLLGKQLSTYNLVEGKNDFEIDQSNLESGVYFYSIAINGIIKESKKLIIVK